MILGFWPSVSLAAFMFSLTLREVEARDGRVSVSRLSIVSGVAFVLQLIMILAS